MSDVVGVERDGALAVVVLNRPDGANSLTTAVKQRLLDALGAVSTDTAIRAVVLTASGRAFCAGQDLGEHEAALRDTGAAAFDTIEQHYAPIVRVLTEMPKPVVAGINGTCVGAGLSLVLACDLRIAADTATFSTAFTAIGLTADSALSRTLPRAIGYSRAQDLLYRNTRLDAEEAHRIGLVHEVVPQATFAERVREVGRVLAAGPTRAFAATKALLAATGDLESTLARESQWQHELGATGDHRDAVAAFMAKRGAAFNGR